MRFDLVCRNISDTVVGPEADGTPRSAMNVGDVGRYSLNLSTGQYCARPCDNVNSIDRIESRKIVLAEGLKTSGPRRDVVKILMQVNRATGLLEVEETNYVNRGTRSQRMSCTRAPFSCFLAPKF